MKTLQEKFNAVNENRYTKAEFLRDAQKQYPQFITQFNGYEDSIQIFKNRIHSIIALDIPNQINFIEKEKLSKIAKSCGIPSKTEKSIESALRSIGKENLHHYENSVYGSGSSLSWSGPRY